MKPLIVAGVTYAIGFIITFGHAFNRHHEVENSLFASAEEKNAVTGFICGLCWPLYWSVEAMKSVRQKPQNDAP